MLCMKHAAPQKFFAFWAGRASTLKMFPKWLSATFEAFFPLLGNSSKKLSSQVGDFLVIESEKISCMKRLLGYCHIHSATNHEVNIRRRDGSYQASFITQ